MSGQCPFQSGQRVQLHQGQTPEAAYVLGVHPSPLGGWEIIVRTLDRVEAPGRTVNVFTTTGASSYLTAASAAASGGSA